MFVFKNKYFFIIESIRDIDLKNIKNSNKFSIIYRSKNIAENIEKLMQFRKICKTRNIDFYVSNNLKLTKTLKADGIYISAYNKNLKITHLRNLNFRIIGSAHNIKELNIKKLQGCSSIIFSRLFETSYKYKKGFLGVVKFNLLKLSRKENLVPLGGIKLSNLNKLSTVKCDSIALSSEIIKKPIIFSRRCF
ncbi:thiamine phosphate synthase [Pelagibacterales bacterium SAG-MED29]|nr:thiamine phosphate synthase [Pelagibacterales bacterium SAG-MED29]